MAMQERHSLSLPQLIAELRKHVPQESWPKLDALLHPDAATSNPMQGLMQICGPEVVKTAITAVVAAPCEPPTKAAEPLQPQPPSQQAPPDAVTNLADIPAPLVHAFSCRKANCRVPGCSALTTKLARLREHAASCDKGPATCLRCRTWAGLKRYSEDGRADEPAPAPDRPAASAGGGAAPMAAPPPPAGPSAAPACAAPFLMGGATPYAIDEQGSAWPSRGAGELFTPRVAPSGAAAVKTARKIEKPAAPAPAPAPAHSRGIKRKGADSVAYPPPSRLALNPLAAPFAHALGGSAAAGPRGAIPSLGLSSSNLNLAEVLGKCVSFSEIGLGSASLADLGAGLHLLPDTSFGAQGAAASHAGLQVRDRGLHIVSRRALHMTAGTFSTCRARRSRVPICPPSCTEPESTPPWEGCCKASSRASRSRPCPCTFPVPSLCLPCTFPVPSLYRQVDLDHVPRRIP